MDDNNCCGVWSATPTPFTDKMQIDKASVKRLVEHHIALGVKGLFLAGTCGEGPWMTDRQRSTLVKTTAKYAAGKLTLAVQVTDNSAVRILDNIRAAKADGADIAVIAPPHFLVNTRPEAILNLYREAIRKSPLPVGIYDRGEYSSVLIPESVLKAVYAEKNVIMIKDSSRDPRRRLIALAARRKRPGLRLFSGDEFNCVEYLQAGYDGLLLGGGIFNGHLAGEIVAAVADGKIARANRLQGRMNRIMYDVYGGRKIACWLSGLKHLLVEMGIFRTWKNYPEFPLTQSCRRAIRQVLKKDADVLLP